MKRKISYVTLTSDLYLLLGISYIMYSLFFGFERIGYASYNISNITSLVAIKICILEIIHSIIISYALHRCDNKLLRIIVIGICLINIIYRIINLISVISIFSSVMLVFGIILLLNLIFY